MGILGIVVGVLFVHHESEVVAMAAAMVMTAIVLVDIFWER